MYKSLALFTVLLCSVFSAAAETLRVLNWDDYIDPEIVSEFEKKYKVKVEYSTFDDIEGMADQLFAPDSRFDVIFPTSYLVSRMSDKDFLEPLDKKSLKNFSDINPVISKALYQNSSGEIYSFPYMWGTTGIGYNAKKLKQMGVDTSNISWSLLFDPKTLEKTSKCGIGILNDRDELIGAALIYKGHSLNSDNPDSLKDAGQTLVDSLPKVRYRNSGQYKEDLIKNEICLAVGYSGDILQSSADNPDIQYAIPTEGANMWIDTMAIPKNSQNKELAYKFINFVSSAEVAGRNSNYNAYPTPMQSGKQFVDQEILDNPAIYPPASVEASLEQIAPVDRRTKRLKHRLWVKAICSGGRWCTVPSDSVF
ncbi:ABC transporter substrate-binding protein [Hahella ganghwensis]|uniref:ABC transporter substrate-binding protein n=1 Tax=Hahella ganghwensis TaxID=286420 RepID=UPI000361255F|nr:spermidine/putrescine ABC transporter substrate-binding protein [Hahella ganghwensis]